MKATQKNVEGIERARKIKDVPWCEEYELMISGMSCVSKADVKSIRKNLHPSFSFRPCESAVLEKGRLRAMRLYKEYNKTDPFEEGVSQTDVALKRAKILKNLLGDVQGTPDIDTPFSILYGCNTFLGRNFYGNVG